MDEATKRDDSVTIDADVLVIGAGAAGLFAALACAGATHDADASDTDAPLRVVVLDAGKKPGLKILVSGGGRCNLTNVRVEASDFDTDAPHALRAILAEYPARTARAWFEAEGVSTYEEPLGKVFPKTDDARTVLAALLDACRRAEIPIIGGAKATAIDTLDTETVVVRTEIRDYVARAVIIATGGLSLPKTGSQGAGYAFAAALGHTVIPTVPALVNLKLEAGSVLDGFAGVTLPVRLDVSPEGTTPEQRCGRKYAPDASACGSVLVTHDGITGPAAFDVGGTALRAVADGRRPLIYADFWALARPDGAWPLFAVGGKAPGACIPPDDMPTVTSFAEFDADMTRIAGAKSIAGALAITLPKTLAARIAERCGVPPGKTWSGCAEGERRRVWTAACHAPVRPIGSGGWDRAEVTSGGVPLGELDRRTLASRHDPRVRFCGEVVNVTGRLGGFNFQWAWSSGFVAGRSVRAALRRRHG